MPIKAGGYRSEFAADSDGGVGDWYGDDHDFSLPDNSLGG